MSDDVDPSHANVMRWLSRDMQDALAVTTPCPSGQLHDWWHHRTELHTFEQAEPVDIIEHWGCTYCGVITTTNPEDFA